MCLLNPGQANSQCCHTECKNYYSLSKQMCLHNVPQPSQKANPPQTQNESSPNDGRTQATSFSPNKGSAFSSKIVMPTTKRSLGARSDISTDEEAELTLNKKKVKQEGNLSLVRHIFTIIGNNAHNEGNTLPLGAFVQGQNNLNLNNMNQSFFANTLANNNLVNNNKLIQSQQRGENLVNSSPILFSMLQNIQPAPNNNLHNVQNPVVFQNLQYGFNPMTLQAFNQAPQLVNKKPEVLVQPQNANNNEVKADNFEDMINDFQAKTLSFLYSQNKMLVDLNEKNELVQDTLACLISEITALK